MSMDYIRRAYGVPAKRGARISFVRGQQQVFGTIVGARNARLRVRMDGERTVCSLHPTWRVGYHEQSSAQGVDAASRRHAS